jgi:hypothetical protein
LVHGERNKQEVFQKEIAKHLDRKAHIVKRGESIGV